jgi:putative endonuclease
MNQFTYLYILQSEINPERFYIGRTQDLRARVSRHSSGQVRHTSKWRPWRLKTYLALSDSSRALALERYLKSASGRAFIKKRLKPPGSVWRLASHCSPRGAARRLSHRN